jgi:hypothetical protein
VLTQTVLAAQNKVAAMPVCTVAPREASSGSVLPTWQSVSVGPHEGLRPLCVWLS